MTDVTAGHEGKDKGLYLSVMKTYVRSVLLPGSNVPRHSRYKRPAHVLFPALTRDQGNTYSLANLEIQQLIKQGNLRSLDSPEKRYNVSSPPINRFFLSYILNRHVEEARKS